MREYNKGERNVRKSPIYLFVLGLVVVVMTAVASAGLVVSAQNSNSSMTMAPEAKPKPKRKPRATGRCDPMQQEQTDLSGTYTGTATHADGSVSKDVTLTVTGNNFTMTGGPQEMSGRITAVTTCGYTAVTMMSGDMTPPAPGTTKPANTAISLRLKKSGSGLMLTSVPGEMRKVSFVTAGAGKAPRKHRAKKTEAPPPPPPAKQ